MPRLQRPRTPVTLAGKFSTIQIVPRDAGIVLDVQGIEHGTDGHAYRSHSFASLSHREAIQLRHLLNEALADTADVLKPVAAAALLVLGMAGLAHATEAHAVSADYRAGLCDGLRAAHTLVPSQAVIVQTTTGDYRCAPVVAPHGLPLATLVLRQSSDQ